MTYEFASPRVAYTLAWPREVVAWELDWVIKLPHQSFREAAELLLEEAFVSDEPRDELRERPSLGWGAPTPATGGLAMLQRLRAVLDHLPERSRPRPYWSQRHQGSDSHVPGRTASEFGRRRVAWAGLANRYLERGYLDVIAPRECVDQAERDQMSVLEERTRELVHVPGLWPLQPVTWDEDTFYSLVEVVGDLVARPRTRSLHSYADCGWHYAQFASVPGQMLYRAQVNDLLAGTGLELASDGEDAGRLVRTVDDSRQNLVEQVLRTPAPNDRDEVAHAIGLFRARSADRGTKRSAVVVLHRVLEERRTMLKQVMLSKDESALFHIANAFDLRHRDGKQHPDYDEAYLDWIFWWYLATIELSDRLIARDATATGGATR